MRTNSCAILHEFVRNNVKVGHEQLHPPPSTHFSPSPSFWRSVNRNRLQLIFHLSQHYINLCRISLGLWGNSKLEEVTCATLLERKVNVPEKNRNAMWRIMSLIWSRMTTLASKLQNELSQNFAPSITVKCRSRI